MIALFQRLLRQSFPAVRLINSFGRLKCNIEVTTLYGKVKPGVLVLNKMQHDLH
jgi:hypothetical protein